MKALWSRIHEATLAADSGHVTGFVTDENQALSLDVEGTREGANQRIRIEQPARQCAGTSR